jgi:hypothetical protein
MKTIYLIILFFGVFISCNENISVKTDVLDNEFILENKRSMARQIAALKDAGYQIFEYKDEERGDTIIMQELYGFFKAWT